MTHVSPEVRAARAALAFNSLRSSFGIRCAVSLFTFDLTKQTVTWNSTLQGIDAAKLVQHLLDLWRIGHKPARVSPEEFFNTDLPDPDLLPVFMRHTGVIVHQLPTLLVLGQPPHLLYSTTASSLGVLYMVAERVLLPGLKQAMAEGG